MNKAKPPRLLAFNPLVDFRLLAEPRRLSVWTGLKWFSRAWVIFTGNIGLWVGVGLLVLLFRMGLGYIPLIGGVVATILDFVCYAGASYIAYCQTTEKNTSIFDLFIAFRHSGYNFKIFLALCVVLFLISSALAFFLTIIMFASNINFDSLVFIGIAFGPPVLVFVLIAMAFWLAPILILFHDLKPLPALKMSFKACIANLLPLTVLGLVFGLTIWVLAIITTIASFMFGGLVVFGLGAILIPMMMICSYVAYRDIYTEN
ncbi:transmembrane protein [Moraxella macacae 0408225]|uniref:Transmembrane protein n=1 Tax=Moraxella macacae 0408225 TaxID=1230338 RepID=L2F822_9GAMM|nr:BPSS1780 family membrane protein [Moraxella macacae]ELA08931.1 transmembrane protein [Moraxella macacae 0408225]